jgi:hypothetical protein
MSLIPIAAAVFGGAVAKLCLYFKNSSWRSSILVTIGVAIFMTSFFSLQKFIEPSVKNPYDISSAASFIMTKTPGVATLFEENNNLNFQTLSFYLSAIDKSSAYGVYRPGEQVDFSYIFSSSPLDQKEFNLIYYNPSSLPYVYQEL